MRQRLDQLAMLRGRQGGIVHVSSVEPGGVGEGRRRRMAGGATVSVGTCVGTCVSLGIVTGWRSCVRCVVGCPARLDEAWGGLGGCSSFQRPGYGCWGELHYKAVRHAGDTPLGGFV